MRSRFDESNEAAYGYLGGMLNAGYISGFVRRREGNTFGVQQTNNVELALPVTVEERGISIPRETMPVKVIGRFLGQRLENGERILRFRALTLDRPSIREMPNRLAWEKPVPDGAKADEFKPFFDPDDDEEVSSPFYKGEKRNGRPCLNVARVAGFIEAYAYGQDKEGNVEKDCLVIALRQTKNPDESLPVRVYGRFTESFKQKIQIALPVFIEGFYRVRLINRGTAKEPQFEYYPYLHCHNIKVATPDDIKVKPEWWGEMKDRLMREVRERTQAAIRASEEGARKIEVAAKPVLSGVMVDKDL
jgi:hypothetical protein